MNLNSYLEAVSVNKSSKSLCQTCDEIISIQLKFYRESRMDPIDLQIPIAFISKFNNYDSSILIKCKSKEVDDYQNNICWAEAKAFRYSAYYLKDH